MPNLLFIHFDANSETGWLGHAASELGFDVSEHFVCDDLDSGQVSRPFPSLDGVDLLVPLGSRWSVYDRENIGSWIDDAITLVQDADERGIPTLGVCFGGQLLATALRGSVTAASEEEIGWYDIAIESGQQAAADAERFAITTGPWFQWHLDVFTPPADATILATSPAGPQAFRLRRALGLQFHPEVNRSVLEAWMVSDRDQLVDCGIDPDELLAETDRLGDAPKQRCLALLTAISDQL